MNRVPIPIDDLQLDGGTQPRAVLDFDAVYDYADAMSAGAKFPAVTVFYDGERYWLADGFHRVRAARAAGLETIECDVRPGVLEDAQWFSFSANRTNGLRRTNDDKQRAVKAAITHPKAAGLSNRQIAAHVGVDEGTVRNWREKLTAEIPQSRKRTGRDGRTINISKIGKNPRRARPDAPPGNTTCAPQALAEPAGATRDLDASPENHVAWAWCQRIYLAAREITDCPVTVKDLAAAIRHSNSSEQLKTQLEKTHDFLAAVLAETGIE